MSPFFRAWAAFVVKYRWPCLFLAIMLTGAAVHQMRTKLRVDTRTESLLPQDAPASVALRDMREEFGDDNLFLVMIEGDVFSMPYLERLKALHDELAAINIELSEDTAPEQPEEPALEGDDGPEGDDGGMFADFVDAEEGWGDEQGGSVFDEITSLINVRDIQADEGSLRVEELLGDWITAEELPAFEQRVLAEKAYVGRIVAPDGDHAVIILRTQLLDEEDRHKVSYAIRDIVRAHDQDGFHIQIAGWPELNTALSESLLENIRILIGLAYVVMIIFLAVFFRHPWGVLGPLLVIIQATLWTFAAMAIMDAPITTVTNVMPVLLICVGIGDSVHVQSVYRQERRRGVANNEAIIRAIGKTGTALVFTSVTTSIGMASFEFATLEAVQDLGVFSAFGVMAALLYTLVCLPVILSFNKKSLLGVRGNGSDAKVGDRVDRILGFCNGLSRRDGDGRRRPWRVLLVGAVVLLLSVAGIYNLKVEQNSLSWFRDGHEVPKAFYDLDEHVGGSANVILLIDGKGDAGVKDRELLLALEKLEEHILAYRDPSSDRTVVTHVLSVLDIVRESWRALNGGKPAFYRLPDSQRGVFDMFTVLENSSPEELKRLVSLDGRQALMLIRVNWMEAGGYKPLAAHIEEGIDKFIGDRAQVRTTGNVFTSLTVFNNVVWDLVKSFGSAFVVITIVMILLIRELKLGLLAMIPNLMPIAMVMGMMGFVGIPLDLNTLLVAAIAIAIAVDDSIHFLHHYQSHYNEQGSVERALEHAFRHAGRAMMFTSAIIVAGFSVNLAATMYNIQLLGVLIGATVVCALLCDLILLPALLRVLPRSSREP